MFLEGQETLTEKTLALSCSDKLLFFGRLSFRGKNFFLGCVFINLLDEAIQAIRCFMVSFSDQGYDQLA